MNTDKLLELKNKLLVRLLDENVELKAEIKSYIKAREGRINTIDELKAENEELKQGLFTSDVDELKAEIKRLKDKLQAVNDDYNNDTKVHNEYADGLLSEIKELKEDNNKHYPKEYKAEADEYFHHNPKGEKLFFFIVGGDEVDVDGDVTRTLNVGCDTIAEYDNI